MREAVAGVIKDGASGVGAIILGEAQNQATVAADEALTPFHQRLLAEELTLASAGTARLAPALASATVDLNPHQIEAAIFALESLSRGGAMLADEVGLGKTVEAGIVIAQLAAEGRKRCLILCPAPLRAQWQTELEEKFGMRAVCVDARNLKGSLNCFDQDGPVIASIQFGANRGADIARIPWDVVIIDEAHRLRNAWKPTHRTGKALRTALEGRPKLLLTATPLQNELMELYGLISLLDPSLLGPENAFRARYVGSADPEDAEASSSLAELKERISPVVQRTLRRQVKEYVKFTARRSIVEDFTPSPDEKELYDNVSEYLKRSELLAIEPGRRVLLTLVYRKLLASSTYAIAPTLKKLADGLEWRIQAAKAGQQFNAEHGLIDPEEVQEFAEEFEELAEPIEEAPPKPASNLHALEGELHELRRYAELAANCKVNAKGEALCRALDRAFTVAATYRWPQKALIFTESKRTQEYLNQLLSERGYRGKISLLSGDGAGPEERKALVQEFRDRSQIFISTEAGAEGLNLQFCNLVVNYDLPWNPQRVEQRIGRCHRYGQTRDVLVINFVNRSNAADARLYELLEKKLSLFDGVFGASDEILGALESGVDFERRVLDIYQNCRGEQAINEAFDLLRSELEGKIGARMQQAREMLLERFDGDVRGRLRIAGSTAKEAIERHKKKTRALTASVRDGVHRSVEEVAREIKSKPTPAISYLALNASELPARLANLAGREGWWFVYRFELSAGKPRERLVHVVLLRDGDGYRALSVNDGDAVARLSGHETSGRSPAVVPVSDAQEAALNAAKEEVCAQAMSAIANENDRARDQAMQFAEDNLLAFHKAVEKARRARDEARHGVLGETDPLQKVRARAALERAEREYRKKVVALRAEEEKRFGDLDKTLAALAHKEKVVAGRTLIATSYFWLE